MSAVTPHANRGAVATARPFRLIRFIESFGFATVVSVIWLDELLDLPHLLFGAPVSPVRVEEALFESVGVTLLGVAVFLATGRILRRLAILEKFVTICAWCRRVRRGGEWLSLEHYFAQHESSTSHGICPDCEARVTRETSHPADFVERRQSADRRRD